MVVVDETPPLNIVKKLQNCRNASGLLMLLK